MTQSFTASASVDEQVYLVSGTQRKLGKRTPEALSVQTRRAML